MFVDRHRSADHSDHLFREYSGCICRRWIAFNFDNLLRCRLLRLDGLWLDHSWCRRPVLRHGLRSVHANRYDQHGDQL